MPQVMDHKRMGCWRALTLSLLVGGMILSIVPTAAAAAADKALVSEDGRTLMFKDWTVLGDQPAGAHLMEREQYRQGEYFRRWDAVHKIVGHQHTSRLSHELLAKRGLGPALLEKGSPAGGKSYNDTLKVLIVRISFETNRSPELTTVDPSGDFVLVPPENTDTLLVDPPPHNRAFYQSHLEGLSEYYRFQSGGRLHIEGTVLPEDPNGSYKVTDPADYGPGAGAGWSIESLEVLVRAMIDAGDQGTLGSEHDFSDHDDNHPFTYIIFVHAGSDWQSDINGDSPNDIPTFFVTLGEPHALAGGGMLSECSVIPETTSQDDYPGSIAAALYHEFGHALGLVDVYNTRTGYPAAGTWDLMDSGTNLPVTMGHITAQNDTIIKSATGVLPPSLGVWNKWFLGWVEMDEVDGREEEYRLPAIQVPRDQYALWDQNNGDFNLDHPQAIRAGASPREYYLIENRYVPPVPDGSGTHTPYVDLRFEKDDDTGVIQYLTGLRAGQWSNSGMYDYFMPDGGLLVWHVNMDRISENLADNTINAYNDGLILMESDGIQDIGVLDAYVLGWYGSARDPFNENNGTTAFGVGSNVSSRNFDRSWSGVKFQDIRNVGSRSAGVMRFNAEVQPLSEGFPWTMESIADDSPAGGGARCLDVESLLPLNFPDGPLLVFADAPGDSSTSQDFAGSIYALTELGENLAGQLPNGPQGAVQMVDAALAGSLVLHPDDEGDQTQRVIYGTHSAFVGEITFTQGGASALGTPVSFGDTLYYGPVVGKDAAGQVLALAPIAPNHLVSWDLNPSSDLTQRALSGDLLCRPLVAPAEGASSLIMAFNSGLTVGSVGSEDFTTHPWTRVPADDLRLVAWPTEAGLAVLAFDATGPLTMNSPPTANPGDLPGLSEALVCDPAIADLDGDGRNDLIVSTAEQVYAFSQEGALLTGWPCRLQDLFPLNEETRLAGPLVVADLTGDGINEVMIQTSGGHLLGLDATGRLLPELPFKWGDERRAGLAKSTSSSGENFLWMVSEGGYATEPFGRNHVNGRVMASSWGLYAGDANVTSQWLGHLGGITRLGPVGAPQTLGVDAPFAAELDRALLYPNPVHDTDLTVRFYAHGEAEASFYLYNLEGEEISRTTFETTANVVNEHRVEVSNLVSGMYLARLIYPAADGLETRTLTLAVER